MKTRISILSALTLAAAATADDSSAGQRGAAIDVPIPPAIVKANVDQSTGNPLLTTNDIFTFFNWYAIGDERANCDDSTGDPVLTPNDIVCYLNTWAEALALQQGTNGQVVH